MSSNRTVTLLQPCYFETWHHRQKLDCGRAETGEMVTLFQSNGYHTILKSVREFEDETKTLNILGEYSRDEEKAARDRIYGTSGPEGESRREEIYGKLYE